MSAEPAKRPRFWFIRHGETAWSLSGQHTGRTDIALTANGETKARELGHHLRKIRCASAWGPGADRHRK